MTDTLIKQSRDEPASYYCLVCKTVTWPADLSWAEFELDPRARFDDGTPVTPEDIIYSANLGKGLSLPAFTRVAQTMASIEKTGPHKVRIHFTMKDNPTLLTVIGLMPIVPKHYWEKRDPFRPSMEIPVGIGPYRIAGPRPAATIAVRAQPRTTGRGTTRSTAAAGTTTRSATTTTATRSCSTRRSASACPTSA